MHVTDFRGFHEPEINKQADEIRDPCNLDRTTRVPSSNVLHHSTSQASIPGRRFPCHGLEFPSTAPIPVERHQVAHRSAEGRFRVRISPPYDLRRQHTTKLSPLKVPQHHPLLPDAFFGYFISPRLYPGAARRASDRRQHGRSRRERDPKVKESFRIQARVPVLAGYHRLWERNGSSPSRFVILVLAWHFGSSHPLLTPTLCATPQGVAGGTTSLGGHRPSVCPSSRPNVNPSLAWRLLPEKEKGPDGEKGLSRKTFRRTRLRGKPP